MLADVAGAAGQQRRGVLPVRAVGIPAETVTIIFSQQESKNPGSTKNLRIYPPSLWGLSAEAVCFETSALRVPRRPTQRSVGARCQNSLFAGGSRSGPSLCTAPSATGREKRGCRGRMLLRRIVVSSSTERDGRKSDGPFSPKPAPSGDFTVSGGFSPKCAPSGDFPRVWGRDPPAKRRARASRTHPTGQSLGGKIRGSSLRGPPVSEVRE